MFDIGFGELVVLGVLALFVFGPEKLPKVAADAARTLRDLRTMAQGARQQLTDTIDPELRSIDVQGLDPREFVRRTLMEEPTADQQTADAARDRAAKGRGPTRSAGSTTLSSNGSAPEPTRAPPAPAAWDADIT